MQNGQKTPIIFDHMSLKFGQIDGFGVSESGDFNLQGRVEGKSVTFTQQYLGKHSVLFKGEIFSSDEGKELIQGTWLQDRDITGTFELLKEY